MKTPIISNPLDPEEFRKQGYQVIDFLTEYFKNIQNYPVQSQVEPGYLRKRVPQSAPYDPESMESILHDIKTDIIPGLTHWQSPNYFAYYPSSGSIAGILGETLAAGFNVVGFNWISSPAATELETIVMDWLANMLNLPESFTFKGNGGGVMMGTTCAALLTTIAAARDRVLLDENINIYKLVVYGSDQTHCSFFKSAKIAGISPKNIRALKTSRANGFALMSQELRDNIQVDIAAGLIPFFLCATVGTTSTAAVDPLPPLCKVAKKWGIWVHVDAAYAGNACICPELRHNITGIEDVDSITLNAHKWLLTTLDCCCLWVQHPGTLINCLSTNPEYLKNKSTSSNCNSQPVIDYKDWQITLSRRFRSLKMWLVLRSYGVNYLRDFIRNHIKMAIYFEGLVSKDPRFEIVVPRKFALVCFRLSVSGDLKEEMLNKVNSKLLEEINSSGRISMTHTVVAGIFMIRFVVGATLTQPHHVASAWEVVKEHATVILESMTTNFHEVSS